MLSVSGPAFIPDDDVGTASHVTQMRRPGVLPHGCAGLRELARQVETLRDLEQGSRQKRRRLPISQNHPHVVAAPRLSIGIAHTVGDAEGIQPRPCDHGRPRDHRCRLRRAMPRAPARSWRDTSQGRRSATSTSSSRAENWRAPERTRTAHVADGQTPGNRPRLASTLKTAQCRFGFGAPRLRLCYGWSALKNISN